MVVQCRSRACRASKTTDRVKKTSTKSDTGGTSCRLSRKFFAQFVCLFRWLFVGFSPSSLRYEAEKRSPKEATGRQA